MAGFSIIFTFVAALNSPPTPELCPFTATVQGTQEQILVRCQAPGLPISDATGVIYALNSYNPTNYFADQASCDAVGQPQVAGQMDVNNQPMLAGYQCVAH
jgi:hypothetical protein